MNPEISGIIGTIVVFLLLFLGMPIAFALMFVGMVGIAYLASIEAALPVAASAVYEVAAFYPYTMIPLFIIMGGLAGSSGMSQRLYSTFDKWFRKLPGGLAIATIGASAAFAALSGSSVASTAAMGTIAAPEMRRFNYHPRLVVSSIVAGGTLAFLIPPSIGFVVYGMLTEQSIGKLLIAGIIPGLILAALFMATIITQVKLNPALAPYMPEPVTWHARLKALSGVWETLVVFLLIMGGIYKGFFTPTDAGAIGAALLVVITFLRGKLNRHNFAIAMREALVVSVMVLFLVAGATVFSYFIALSTIPVKVASWVSTIAVSRYIILMFIIFIYLILGCLLDSISMMILTLPVIFPVVLALNFDPVWFGVVCVLMMEAGLITPPMGLNVYTVVGVVRDVSVKEAFLGSLPFVVAIIAVTVLITVFPKVVLYLPKMMLG